MYNCGDPPSASNTPVPILSNLGPSGYVGVLGGANAGYPTSLVGCYEYQPFNGMFHRNSRVRIAEITDGTSNTMGIAERDDHFVTTNWVGVIPGAEAIYNPLRAWAATTGDRPIIAVLAHGRQSAVNAPRCQSRGLPIAAPRRRPISSSWTARSGSQDLHRPSHHLGTLYAQWRRDYLQ